MPKHSLGTAKLAASVFTNKTSAKHLPVAPFVLDSLRKMGENVPPLANRLISDTLCRSFPGGRVVVRLQISKPNASLAKKAVVLTFLSVTPRIEFNWVFFPNLPKNKSCLFDDDNGTCFTSSTSKRAQMTQTTSNLPRYSAATFCKDYRSGKLTEMIYAEEGGHQCAQDGCKNQLHESRDGGGSVCSKCSEENARRFTSAVSSYTAPSSISPADVDKILAIAAKD